VKIKQGFSLCKFIPEPALSVVEGLEMTKKLNRYLGRRNMQAKALKLKDRKFDNWRTEVEDRWNYEDFLRDEGWRKDWISFDSVLFNPGDNRVYCGITSFDADIFYAYDRNEKRFISLDYHRIADPFDAKFHRSLVRSKNGRIYAAVALLHDIDSYWEAPGGAIVEYDPKTGDLRKLGIPIPHVYIQSIALDDERRIIYGQTFTPEMLFAFDLASKKTKILGPIGSGMQMGQGENITLDNEGNVWGGWSVTRAWQSSPGVDSLRLFKYDRKRGRIEYLKHGLPRLDGAYGFAKLDGIYNPGNGFIYAGTGEGGLMKIDPETGEVKLLGAPCPPRRLAAMVKGPDGFLYGAGGKFGNASIFRLDLETDEYEVLGKIEDKEEGVSAWQIHDMDITDDMVIYAGENDNINRSSYLWEIKL